jgi:hypothetical protein
MNLARNLHARSKTARNGAMKPYNSNCHLPTRPTVTARRARVDRQTAALAEAGRANAVCCNMTPHMKQPTWWYRTRASASKRAGHRSLAPLTLSTLLACRRGARRWNSPRGQGGQGAARARTLRLRPIIPGEKACRRAKRKRAGPGRDAGPPAAHADWCDGDGLASTCTHCSADGRSAELSLRHCSVRLATSCGHSSGTLRQCSRFRAGLLPQE